MDTAINLNRPRGWFAEPPPAMSSKVSTVARSRLSCEAANASTPSSFYTSGSGLWNSSHYLVGVLSCGPSIPACSGHNTYSKFANFYSQIRPYIDP